MFVKVKTLKMWRKIRQLMSGQRWIVIYNTPHFLFFSYVFYRSYIKNLSISKDTLSSKETFRLNSTMIFGCFRINKTTQNITTLLLISVMFFSIGVGSYEANHRPFRSFRRKNSCYCPKSDLWLSKYSEDVKFSLISYEYRTHLKGNHLF